MFDMRPYLWLIPALPLAASALTAFFGPRLLRRHSHWPCIIAAVLSCILAFLTLAQVNRGGQSVIRTYYEWVNLPTLNIGFSLHADGLTAIMLVMITFIGSLIAIYSVGYMHGDPGYARFFAEIALFIFSMTGLVLADNFVLLYAFWEGVGLCSYLLIGFWFAKPSAALAARKAFLVTRLGDIGFLIGILLIWSQFQSGGQQLFRLDYEAVFAHAAEQHKGLLVAVCFLLFSGAIGKSAQFPLHVWLPDAMEGPTPVSALIHAATMVTAGVYMVARCTPLFEHAPSAQLFVACIGGFTALLAALIAITQNDLKRVLAYSTISQLGYMFLALGSGTWARGAPEPQALVTLAVVAGIFHLFTHAFFKALLFLSAGSVMHAMGGVIDMRRFGGLRYALPRTHWTFLCGALALSAFPLITAGFWSKDQIMVAVFAASGLGHPHRAVYVVLFIVALVTAGLTAFYTFRAYFLTFWGDLRLPPEAGEHAHESPSVMTIPLIILAVGALGVGFVNAEPITEWLNDFLVARIQPPLQPAEHALVAVPTKLAVMFGSTVFALAGIALAWWTYALRPGLADRLAGRMQALYQLSLNKFYLDELYNFFIVQPLAGFAEFCRIFDLYVVDGLVDITGQIPRLLGVVFRPIQNGLTQFYALAMALGLVVFVVALLWRSFQ
jgi:NADH-quinone oxidoreductase subunit L